MIDRYPMDRTKEVVIMAFPVVIKVFFKASSGEIFLALSYLYFERK